MEAFNDTISCRLLEMVGENPLINVPIDLSINMDVITHDDPDPKFVNVEVLRGNTISGNGRRYSNNNVKEIVGMIPGLQGFLGHPNPMMYGFEFREPQSLFVGAIAETLTDGSVRTVAKAYLFKSSHLREWIPKSIAANNPMTVSINGMADIIQNGDYVDVVAINKLESIDWANPGTEGVDTSRALSVVREMLENNGGIMDTKEVIKNITVTEFKAYNPDAYNGIIKSATVTELQESNPTLVQSIKDSARITELNLCISGQQKSVKIEEMQSVITGLESKIQEMTDSMSIQKLDKYKETKITEQMSDEHVREKLMKRVSGKTEAEIDASISAEITYIREMMGLGENEPIGRMVNKDRNSDTIKESVASIFGRKETK